MLFDRGVVEGLRLVGQRTRARASPARAPARDRDRRRGSCRRWEREFLRGSAACSSCPHRSTPPDRGRRDRRGSSIRRRRAVRRSSFAGRFERCDPSHAACADMWHRLSDPRSAAGREVIHFRRTKPGPWIGIAEISSQNSAHCATTRDKVVPITLQRATPVRRRRRARRAPPIAFLWRFEGDPGVTIGWASPDRGDMRVARNASRCACGARDHSTVELCSVFTVVLPVPDCASCVRGRFRPTPGRGAASPPDSRARPRSAYGPRRR
jgi:hypothetical protein